MAWVAGVASCIYPPSKGPFTLSVAMMVLLEDFSGLRLVGDLDVRK